MTVATPEVFLILATDETIAVARVETACGDGEQTADHGQARAGEKS